jgi:hypothetical protein
MHLAARLATTVVKVVPHSCALARACHRGRWRTQKIARTFRNPFRAKAHLAGQRVLSDQSTRELFDRQGTLKVELRATIYRHRGAQFSVCRSAGIAEVGDPQVLPEDVADEILGFHICAVRECFNPSIEPTAQGLRPWIRSARRAPAATRAGR